MVVRNLLSRLFRKRGRRHIHCHAHVAEVYKCQCGDTFVRERR
jgi:hypothetical protein